LSKKVEFFSFNLLITKIFQKNAPFAIDSEGTDEPNPTSSVS
jgi:hypothetical protein